MTTSGHTPALADQVAEVVLGHPAVVRLDSGRFGVIATYLPGHQVTGVRAPDPGEAVEVAVVLRLDRPLPEIVAELRSRIKTVAGTVPVDITVSDVVTEEPTTAQGGT